MKEQKTLNDLIGYYEEEVNNYTSSPKDEYTIFDHIAYARHQCNINILSQLKQLKEDNLYQKMWEELKEDCKLVEEGDDYVLYERLEQLEHKYGCFNE